MIRYENKHETTKGRLFCILISIVGIPSFGYLLKLISDEINQNLEKSRVEIEHKSGRACPSMAIEFSVNNLVSFAL